MCIAGCASEAWSQVKFVRSTDKARTTHNQVSATTARRLQIYGERPRLPDGDRRAERSDCRNAGRS